ncbi:hypothetical protein HDU82_002566 [Entophlyctis luteolus]|nr:hypothetical protein HDU82_002566 [Entophlyctis luteolus]
MPLSNLTDEPDKAKSTEVQILIFDDRRHLSCEVEQIIVPVVDVHNNDDVGRNPRENRRRSHLVPEVSASAKFESVGRSTHGGTSSKQLFLGSTPFMPLIMSRFKSGSFSSVIDHRRYGQIVRDSDLQKFLALLYTGTAMLLNLGLFFVTWTMSNGVVLTVPPTIMKPSLGLVLEVSVLVLNKYTIDAMNFGGRAEVIKVRAPITATGISAMAIQSSYGLMSCVEFFSDTMFDRKYPTIESSIASLEFALGDSFGCIRAERTCDDGKTWMISGPQIDGILDTSDVMIGTGIQTSLSSSCTCATSDELYFGANDTISVVQTKIELSSSEIISELLVRGSYICSLGQVATCKTLISNITTIIVTSTFSTDGSAASMSLIQVESNLVLEEPVSIPALGLAISAIFGLNASQTVTPAGFLNYAFQMVGNADETVRDSLISAAVEAMYAVLIRAGIRRTFDAQGTRCNRVITRSDQTGVLLNSRGYVAIYFVASLQFVLSAASFGLAVSWYFNKAPLSPAIRAIRNPMYLLALICNSKFATLLEGTANAKKENEIWKKLDVVAKLGEDIETVDDDIGIIKLCM